MSLLLLLAGGAIVLSYFNILMFFINIGKGFTNE